MNGAFEADSLADMNADAVGILECLRDVQRERALRSADGELGGRVLAIKAFQHARFARTYADLLASPAYAAAARFFLNELYGPHDFTQRDQQFERVVPALVRLFPAEIVSTVRALAELHRLSETMDTRMAQAISSPALDAATYACAWRQVGAAEMRDKQIGLMVEVGSALERYTRRPWLRHTLRAMRKPAQLAGLSSLQAFLEAGFETFREMPTPATFLDIVASRERALAHALFQGEAPQVLGS